MDGWMDGWSAGLVVSFCFGLGWWVWLGCLLFCFGVVVVVVVGWLAVLHDFGNLLLRWKEPGGGGGGGGWFKCVRTGAGEVVGGEAGGCCAWG